MVYLDYSATTMVEEEVLHSFYDTCKNYIGNANSLHKLGMEAKQLSDLATRQIASLLGVKEKEIIYTSGASESNNTAIIGTALQYQKRGKHILTTDLEHSSITEACVYLRTLGFEIEQIPLMEDGTVDLSSLKERVRQDTILVTLASVSSELGIRQPVEEIGTILKAYPKCLFHVDMTQSIGKVSIPFDLIDLASFSAHKFYGIKGIGCLVKKETVRLVPLIHGGKSTTEFRSGTPALPLIVSMAKALRMALEHEREKYEMVEAREEVLIDGLHMLEGMKVNHPESAIPHIVNFSLMTVKPETMLHALEESEIYISTKTACAKGSSQSIAVYALTRNQKQAETSMRVSISHKTTATEIEYFLTKLKECYEHLK